MPQPCERGRAGDGNYSLCVPYYYLALFMRDKPVSLSGQSNPEQQGRNQ